MTTWYDDDGDYDSYQYEADEPQYDDYDYSRCYPPDGESYYQPTRIERIQDWLDYRRYLIGQWFKNHFGRCPDCKRWYIFGGNHDNCIPF